MKYPLTTLRNVQIHFKIALIYIKNGIEGVLNIYYNLINVFFVKICLRHLFVNTLVKNLTLKYFLCVLLLNVEFHLLLIRPVYVLFHRLFLFFNIPLLNKILQHYYFMDIKFLINSVLVLANNFFSFTSIFWYIV